MALVMFRFQYDQEELYGQKGLENVGILERMLSDHIIRSYDEMAALNDN